jgi:hypothetical protein
MAAGISGCRRRSPGTTRAESVDYGRLGWVAGRPDDRLDKGEHVALQVTDVQKALKGQLTGSR